MHEERTSGNSKSKVILNKLRLSIIISGSILIAEIIGGVLSNSLALLSDAGHVFTDLLALTIAWFAARQAEKPSHAGMTFGYHRWGILAALINALSLIGVSGAIFYEAYHRWQEPPEINGLLMLIVAVVGLIANMVVVGQLQHDSKENLNVKGAFWHAAGDALSSVGVIVAGIIIMVTGRFWVDPLMSVLVAVIILVGAWRLLRESVNVLLEAPPGHLKTDVVARELARVPGVKEIHDLHIWSIGPGFHALSCHVWVDDQALSAGSHILDDMREILSEKYHITHSTLQLECLNCEGGLFCSFAQPVEEEHPHRHGL